MRVQLSLSWLLGVLAIALVAPVSAQTPPPEGAAPAVSTRAADLLIPARAGVGYSTSGGGYDGFGSFQGFIPIDQTPGKNLFYLVPQLLIDNDANLGGNLLVGYRTYHPGSDRIYGGYIAYDNRDTGDNVFSQIGVGLETLGRGWDARLNAYLPVGSTRRTVSETSVITGFQPTGLRFQNNFLLSSGIAQETTTRDVDAAMAGFDAEAGGTLLRLGNSGDLRGYAGLYYLAAGDTAVGVRGRLEFRPIENVTAGLAVQHDGIFGTNVVATIALSFPNTRPKGVEPRSVLARMGEMPGRLNAIVVDRQRETVQTTANVIDLIVQNPATRQPYVFQHVALGTSGGNGTFENPFGAVQSAVNATRSDGNAIVYVQVGTNPGIPAFTIPDRVQVLSSFPVQTLPALLQGQRIPDVTLPLSGLGAVRPTVTGTVTMRSDTVLSGFDITSATGAGITFNNVNRIEIRDSIIRNTASAGILGNGVAIANLFRNQVIAAQDQGIYLQNVGTATVTDSTVTNTRAGSGVISNPISGDITIGTITIPNPGSIIPLPSGQGIVIATTTGDVNLARNTITGTGTQGIVVLNARGTVAITDSSVANTVGANFPVSIPGFGNFQVTTGQGIVVSGVSGNVDVSRNTITAVNGQGIAIAGTTNGTTTIANNIVRNTADQGMILAGISGMTNVANNQISGISARGIPLTVPILGAITIGTGQGLALLNAIDTVNISGNTIEQASGFLPLQPLLPGGEGLQVTNVTGQLNLNITNNQIRNNFNDGMIISLAGSTGGTTTPAVANITIAGNTIENNGGANPIRGDGIAIAIEQDASVPNLLIENNTIRGNGDEGIDIRLATTATILTPATASLTGTIRNNTISTPPLSATSGQNGIQVQAQSNSVARITIDSNTITTANPTFRAITLQTVNSLLIGGTPRLSADVRLNQLTSNTTPAFLAQTDATFLAPPQVLCLNLAGNAVNRNTSNTGYTITRNTGTLQVVNQPNVGANNTGTVFQTGVITPVAACP